MAAFYRRSMIAISTILTVLTAFAQSHARADVGSADFNIPPEGLLWVDYQIYKPYVRWVLCGYLPLSSGCYGAGDLGPFVRPCIMMHSTLKPVGKNKERDLYILDAGNKPQDKVTLYIYKYTQESDKSRAHGTYSLYKNLYLTNAKGSSKAKCLLAANEYRIYTGLSTEEGLWAIDRRADYKVMKLPSTSPPSTLAYITADETGKIIFGFKNGAFVETDGNGRLLGTGGGGNMILNNRNGTNLP